jgi:hypothetical protein
MKNFLIVSSFVAAVVTALVVFGFIYKGQTCIGCGRPKTVWQLDEDCRCRECAAIAKASNYEGLERYEKGTNRLLPSWMPNLK